MAEARKTPLEIFPKLAQIQKQWTQCADCNDKHPKWAETSRGILICLQCSGVHRSLGTHISKVRSLTLDNWTQQMVDQMQASNLEFNNVFEYHVPKAFMKPTEKTRRDIRAKYIKAKYVGLKEFSVSKQCIPAFHKSKTQSKPLPPVFAPKQYDAEDAEDDAKAAENDAEHAGMKEYSGVIQIHAVCANHLPKADLLSDSDPYVVFDNQLGQTVKSKVIDNDNDPKWNEHLVLSVNEHIPVAIRIYDEDDISSDDLLCTSSLSVDKECKNGEEVKFNMTMNVEKKYQKQKKHATLTFTVIYNKMDAQ
mmetsp:Transcript_38330/g.61280  ORF Transcript_38330/g.61280 Transcript_38330/m.61280 type:complete len:307 (+) Transcript_38330:341-1261(+)